MGASDIWLIFDGKWQESDIKWNSYRAPRTNQCVQDKQTNRETERSSHSGTDACICVCVCVKWNKAQAFGWLYLHAWKSQLITDLKCIHDSIPITQSYISKPWKRNQSLFRDSISSTYNNINHYHLKWSAAFAFLFINAGPIMHGDISNRRSSKDAVSIYLHMYVFINLFIPLKNIWCTSFKIKLFFLFIFRYLWIETHKCDHGTGGMMLGAGQ